MSDRQHQLPSFEQLAGKETMNGKLPSFEDIVSAEPSGKKKVSLGSAGAERLQTGTENLSTRPLGLVEKGNIDLYKQPSVPNPETGGESTVWSMSIGTDKGETLISRVTPDGKILSKQEAIDYYKKTGQHLGIFKDIKSANQYAEQLHNDYEKGIYAIVPKSKSSSILTQEEINNAMDFVRQRKEPIVLPANIKREEQKLDDVSRKVYFGDVSYDDIVGLRNSQYTKEVSHNIIRNFVPDATEENIDTQETISKAVKNIKEKNRVNATILLDNVDAESLKNAQSAIGSFEIKTDIKENIATPGGGGLQTNVTATDKIPAIDFTNKQSVANAINFVEDKGYLVDKSGKESSYTLDKFHTDLKNVYENLVANSPIDAEIDFFSDKIQSAVIGKQVLAEGSEKSTDYGVNDKLRAEHFKIGLNYIKDLQPGTYKGIMLGLRNKGDISETDYQQVSRIGQDIMNKQVFRQAAYEPELIDKETNFDYRTHQDKKAEYAGDIGEWLKSNGYKNYREFPAQLIRKAAAAVGVEDKQIVEELILDEGRPMYDAIPKSGGVEAFIRGVEQPISGIVSTLDKWVNESPAETYLRSKKLDTGSAQKVPDAKGELSNELPSDRGNIWYDVLEGTGQFLPQVLLTKGIGTPLGVLGRTAVESAALSTYGGTFISTFLQTYGDAYSEALRKTGEPSTSRLMGGIDATVSALAEEILPDIKIAGKAFNGFKEGFVNDMVGLLKKGGDISILKEKSQPLIKKFLGEVLSIEEKEVTEEVVTQWGSYINEAIFSPGTVKDRDLGKETWDTITATALSMIVPAVLGGGGVAINKDFTIDGLHAASINFDNSKSSLEKALLNKTISQDEYNNGIKLLSTNRQSLFSSPITSENGERLTPQERKDYAYQETLIKIENEKLKNTTGVQKEVIDNKIKEAENIQREILMPDKSKEKAVETIPETDVGGNVVDTKLAQPVELTVTERTDTENLLNQEFPKVDENGERKLYRYEKVNLQNPLTGEYETMEAYVAQKRLIDRHNILKDLIEKCL